MSCWIRAVEHRKCVAGPSGAHPGLQDRILQNYTRIENVHEYAKKLSIFYYVKKSSKLLVFLFLCWEIIKFLNASMLKKVVFELVQQLHDATEIANVAIALAALADKLKTIVSDKVN